MERFSFIDAELMDFLRDENKEVIVKMFPHYEAAEEWLLENGKKYGWTNTGVRYWNWDDEF